MCNLGKISIQKLRAIQIQANAVKGLAVFPFHWISTEVFYLRAGYLNIAFKLLDLFNGFKQ